MIPKGEFLMLYVLSLSVDTILLLVFAALFAGFVLALWLSVSRAKKKGSIDDDLNPADSTDSKENPDTPETLAENADASDPADDPGTPDEAETLEDEEDTEELWTPPEPEAFPARVVDMRVVTGNVGGNKRPKTGVSFLVTFLTDDGKRTEYPVPEELYVTLDIDQTGTLVILNGGFFDFGAGDEYDPAAVEEFEKTFDPFSDTE
jgi:hypothetical protein